MLILKKVTIGGAWVAQSVEHPTSTQVMISQSVSLSPPSGSILMVWSLLGILSFLLSAPPPLMFSLSLSLSQNKSKIKKKKKEN